MNNTNQTVTLRRGWPIAKFSEVSEISEISLEDKSKDKIDVQDLEGVDVPDECRQEIITLLKRNKDRFASDDRQLGRTSTVKMRIDTGNHPPIKKDLTQLP